MIAILAQAFDKAAKLPVVMQEQTAQQLLEDIETEFKWTQTFAQSQDKLAKLATKARKDIKAGRVEQIGFDEL